MKTLSRSSSSLFFLLSLVLLASCGTSEVSTSHVAPPPVPVSIAPEARTQANQGALEIPLRKAPPIFSYTSSRRRDPFRSVIASSESQSRPKGSLPPLQRVAIADMKLVGIITGANAPKAMIKTPDGKGYTVRVGTRLGLGHGVIRKITSRNIMIEETEMNVFGEPRKRVFLVKLHPQKEGLE